MPNRSRRKYNKFIVAILSLTTSIQAASLSTGESKIDSSINLSQSQVNRDQIYNQYKNFYQNRFGKNINQIISNNNNAPANSANAPRFNIRNNNKNLNIVNNNQNNLNNKFINQQRFNQLTPRQRQQYIANQRRLQQQYILQQKNKNQQTLLNPVNNFSSNPLTYPNTFQIQSSNNLKAKPEKIQTTVLDPVDSSLDKTVSQADTSPLNNSEVTSQATTVNLAPENEDYEEDIEYSGFGSDESQEEKPKQITLRTQALNNNAEDENNHENDNQTGSLDDFNNSMFGVQHIKNNLGKKSQNFGIENKHYNGFGNLKPVLKFNPNQAFPPKNEGTSKENLSSLADNLPKKIYGSKVQLNKNNSPLATDADLISTDIQKPSAHHGINSNKNKIWTDEDCYINGFSRCLNGGICSPSMRKCFCAAGFTGDRCQFTDCDASQTLVNGTCGNFDLLKMTVNSPGISRMVMDLGIPLKELSSKSSISLGARDVLKEHIFDKLEQNGDKSLNKLGISNLLIQEHEQQQELENKNRQKRDTEEQILIAKHEKQVQQKMEHQLSELKIEPDNIYEKIGITVEWFDILNTANHDLQAKLTLSLPLGTGHEMKKWENILKLALDRSILIDSHSIKIEDFDECNSEYNRCNSKLNTICENLIGGYQCRCMAEDIFAPSENKYDSFGQYGLSDKNLRGKLLSPKSLKAEKLKASKQEQPKCFDPCIEPLTGNPVCQNNGRCIPKLAAQKSSQYKNTYHDPTNNKRYAYLEERLEDVYDMSTPPTCFCINGFEGNFCQKKIETSNNSMVLKVWIISAVLFIILTLILSRKIYNLICDIQSEQEIYRRNTVNANRQNSVNSDSDYVPNESFRTQLNHEIPAYNQQYDKIRADLLTQQATLAQNNTATQNPTSGNPTGPVGELNNQLRQNSNTQIGTNHDKIAPLKNNTNVGNAIVHHRPSTNPNPLIHTHPNSVNTQATAMRNSSKSNPIYGTPNNTLNINQSQKNSNLSIRQQNITYPTSAPHSSQLHSQQNSHPHPSLINPQTSIHNKNCLPIPQIQSSKKSNQSTNSNLIQFNSCSSKQASTKQPQQHQQYANNGYAGSQKRDLNQQGGSHQKNKKNSSNNNNSNKNRNTSPGFVLQASFDDNKEAMRQHQHDHGDVSRHIYAYY